MVLIIRSMFIRINVQYTLSNNSTQTHDLFRLIWSDHNSYFWLWLWAWNIYLFEWLKFDFNNKSKYEQ